MLVCIRCNRDISQHDECYEKDPIVCHGCTVKERDALKQEVETFKTLIGYSKDDDVVGEDTKRCCRTCEPTSCSIAPSYETCIFAPLAVEESKRGTPQPERLCRYYCVKYHPLDKEGD